MKRIGMMMGAMLLMVVPLRAWHGEVTITTPNTAMILHAAEDRKSVV